LAFVTDQMQTILCYLSDLNDRCRRITQVLPKPSHTFPLYRMRSEWSLLSSERWRKQCLGEMRAFAFTLTHPLFD
jgi:hypothetical protein